MQHAYIPVDQHLVCFEMKCLLVGLNISVLEDLKYVLNFEFAYRRWQHISCRFISVHFL